MTRKNPSLRTWGALAAVMALSLVLTACDVGAEPDASPLEDLQLTGVDFQLNSLVISNNGDEEVRTQDLWAYRDGEMFQFDIFIIEPRATILFSMRDLGDISTAGGELALADSDTFTDADAMLQYVRWGEGDFALASTATEAGLWPAEGSAEVTDETVVLSRVDPTGNDPTVWQASDEVP